MSQFEYVSIAIALVYSFAIARLIGALPSALAAGRTDMSSTHDRVLQEIEALDAEVRRLKEVKVMHKEFRRYSCMPIGVMSKPCACCRGWTKKKHLCTHKFCDKPCRKQDQELAQQ